MSSTNGSKGLKIDIDVLEPDLLGLSPTLNSYAISGSSVLERRD